MIRGKLERMEADRLVERAGSQLTKAKEMAVDVIDEAAFMARLELVLP